MRIQSPINIGPFSLSFACPSLTIVEYLERFFAGYECNRNPDFIVNIFPSAELPPPLSQLQKQWVPLVVNGKGFEIGPDLINGELDLIQRECSITVHKDFFRLPLINVFQGFLYRLYHTLCMDLSIKSGFIHGCGVIKENAGYLFIGHHKSGKTTVGRLSNGLVIHDDQIIMTHDYKSLTMDSPPLPGRLRHHPDKSCTIDKIFIIVQNKRVSVNKLDPARAMKSLYDEIVLPLTLSSTDEGIARTKKAESCFDVLKLLPVFELHFDKWGEFWKVLSDVR